MIAQTHCDRSNPVVEVSALNNIPNGALLGNGASNWNYHLSRIGKSCGVRAVPKVGPQYKGCQECGFGSVLYFLNYASFASNGCELTADGEAFKAATRQELAAVGGIW